MSSIIYSIVVRDPDIVLSEYSRAQGNFPQLTRTLLPRLPRSGKFSYNYNSQYTFHYISSENLIFMCLAQEKFPKRICFSFLQQVQDIFLSRYRDLINTVIAFGVNSEFSEVLKTKMQYYSTDPSVDKLQTLRESVDQVKNVMVENIDKVLARGTKVELLVKKFQIMSDQAVTMRKRASQVRRVMWYQNLKYYVFCAGIVVLLIMIILFSVCSFDFSEC